MKTFDIRRFWQIFKYTIALERGYILRLFIGFTLVCFFTLMLLMYGGAQLGRMLNADLTSSYIITSVNNCFYIYVICMFIGSSIMFKNMNTMQGRITFLLNPSSSLEKFIVRWIDVVVIGTFIFAVAFIVADLLRMLVLPLLIDNHYGATFPAYFSATYDNPSVGKISTVSGDSYSVGYAIGNVASLFYKSRGTLANCYVASFAVLVQSAYMLCGSLFRKHAWIFGTLALIALFALSFCVPSGYALFEIILCLLLAVANYVMAYNLFKRVQVINNKWVNL